MRKKLKVMLLTFIVISFGVVTLPVYSQHQMAMPMFTTVRVLNKSAVLPNTDISLADQSRKTDTQGFATFEDIPHGEYSLRTFYNGKTYNNTVKLEGKPLTVDIAQIGWFSASTGTTVLLVLTAAALLIALALYGNISNKNAPAVKKTNIQTLAFDALVFVLVFAFIITIATYQKTIVAALFNASRANQSMAAELSGIPQPKNVQIFADDQVATVTWDPASGGNVVGYVVRWGKESLGTFTDMKQTIHPITQIQPLENGVKYIVQVQSVQGSYNTIPTSSEQGGSDTYAVANGNVSLPVVTSVIPTTARVDAMRSRLTGFFDDFNISAGGFDEAKWNHASTACVKVGEDGQFINSQFHAHNQTESNCDRDGNVARPRAIFDITGKSEANPGQIEFDMDGVSQPRDVWYIDIIPADARKNGMPLDITSHNDLFDADHEDPGRMIRITQYMDKIVFHYYDASNNPHSLNQTKQASATWDGGASIQDCNIAGKQTGGFSPIAEISAPINPVPNVRRHWVIQYSPQKIKLFIDSALMAEAATPALFANINKYQIHSTLFSYNTGKQYNGIIGPTTSMLHWDNFGFNGPAPTIVTHNYIDGEATGTTPMIARGTVANPVPSGNRTTKIPIPDPIGTPVGKARLMFTMQPFGNSTYTWNSSQNVVVNGKTYPLPDPKLNIQSQNITEIVGTYTPHSDGIYIDPAELIQGMNQLMFNVGTDVLNVHIELDYDKNNAPTFTQPRDLFSNFTSYISPAMRANDSYWFIEQKMGLESGGTPVATSSITQSPSPNKTPSLVPTATPASTTINNITPPPLVSTGSRVAIYAAGNAVRGVYPSIGLNVNINNAGFRQVASFTGIAGNPVTGQFVEKVFNATYKIVPEQVRVRFLNDYFNSATGEDRNVRIEKINIDGTDYMSASPSVLSTGTWTTDNGCSKGYKQSEWLMCGGYFQYK